MAETKRYRVDLTAEELRVLSTLMEVQSQVSEEPADVRIYKSISRKLKYRLAQVSETREQKEGDDELLDR